MIVSMGKAAKLKSVSVPTIAKAVKTGRLPAKKNENGSYSINTIDLDRAFEKKIRIKGPKTAIHISREDWDREKSHINRIISDAQITVSLIKFWSVMSTAVATIAILISIYALWGK